MKISQTANQLTGRAIGSIILACFGAAWIGLSLLARQAFTVETVCAVALGLAGLLQAAIHLLRQAKRWPRVPENPAENRIFAWINAIQWTVGGVLAFTLGRMHLDAYIPCAITAIVGLHLFPLARLFRYPMHYATGALLVAWAAASAALTPADQVQGISALGTGLLLWGSAAITLSRCIRMVRQPDPSLAAGNAGPQTA